MSVSIQTWNHFTTYFHPQKFWSNETSYDETFRVVDKALWTAIVHVMMGHCDAKAALCQFFNESREILKIEKAKLVSASSKRNKRKLPTENIDNDHVEESSTKKNKHDVPVCHSSDLPANPPHSSGKFIFPPFFIYKSHSLSSRCSSLDLSSDIPAQSGCPGRLFWSGRLHDGQASS
jgi:hypothetical protein